MRKNKYIPLFLIFIFNIVLAQIPFSFGNLNSDKKGLPIGGGQGYFPIIVNLD